MAKKTLKEKLNAAGRWVLGGGLGLAIGWSVVYAGSRFLAEEYADRRIENLEVPEKLYNRIPYEKSSGFFDAKDVTPLITKPGSSDSLESSIVYDYKIKETEEYKDYLEKVKDIRNGVNGNSLKILFAVKGLGYLGGAIGGGFYYSRYRRRKKGEIEED